MLDAHHAAQGSAEWLAARCGKVTGSKLGAVMARGKGLTRGAYMEQLIAERMTGEPVEVYQSAAMLRGSELEPMARQAYEFHSDLAVTEVGFVPHPTIGASGASPDGLVEPSGLVEIKCPLPHTHARTLRNGTIPPEHRPQLLWALECTGREWCDFVSFCPRMPLFVDRIYARNNREKIAEMRDAVETFIAELENEIAMIEQRYG
ncbi:MAG: lambda exonuclease family protein [Pseudomonadota bacterium]